MQARLQNIPLCSPGSFRYLTIPHTFGPSSSPYSFSSPVDQFLSPPFHKGIFRYLTIRRTSESSPPPSTPHSFSCPVDQLLSAPFHARASRSCTRSDWSTPTSSQTTSPSTPRPLLVAHRPKTRQRRRRQQRQHKLRSTSVLSISATRCSPRTRCPESRRGPRRTSRPRPAAGLPGARPSTFGPSVASCTRS